MNKSNLKQELKSLIIIECDKEDEFTTDDINDLDPLFGPEANLDLDSLDALQLSVAIKKKYKVRIEGAKEGRAVFFSIDSLADFIMENS